MNPKLNTAIIASSNSNIVGIIKQDLKSKNVKNLITTSKEQECIKELKGNPDALLIIDWALGNAKVCEILEADQQHGMCSLGKRPVFLFALQKPQDDVIQGVAIEYGIALLHIGELSAEKINSYLNKLLETEIFNLKIQQGLMDVYEAKKAKNTKKALEILEALNKEYPQESHVACELAEIYFNQNELGKVQKILEPFVEREHKNPRALNIYGRMLLKQKKFDEATIYLQRASIINPNNVNRLLRLADAYLQIEKPHKAKENYQKALELDPKNKQAVKGMGQSLLMTGEINEALSFLRQLSGPSEMASVFNAAAIIAITNERFEEGLNLYNTAIKTIGKEHKDVLSKLAFNIGLAHYKNNKLDLSFYFMYAALKLDPNNDKAKHNLSILSNKITYEKEVKDYLDNISNDEDILEALFLNDISAIIIKEEQPQQEEQQKTTKEIILEEETFEEESIEEQS